MQWKWDIQARARAEVGTGARPREGVANSPVVEATPGDPLDSERKSLVK